jgi:hypothetical protein
MQASYLDENSRRFEVSRYISLSSLDLAAFQQLLSGGACDFDVPESLYDHDYPGHYNRHLLRVSVTVIYPNTTKFDNVKATLTLVANKVRVSTDVSSGYPETPVGADPRFIYNYGAVPQKIALGNAQDDPGLFLTAINNNLSDTRYLPFENAGAIGTWHLDMPQSSNEIHVAGVTDVVLHFFYTAVDGGDSFKQAVQSSNSAFTPTSAVHVVSALYTGPTTSPDRSTTTAGFSPKFSVDIHPAIFPECSFGKSVTVSAIGAIAVSPYSGTFMLDFIGPGTRSEVMLNPVSNLSEPSLSVGVVAAAPDAMLGTWEFAVRKQSTEGSMPVTAEELSDLLLVMSYEVH